MKKGFYRVENGMFILNERCRLTAADVEKIEKKGIDDKKTKKSYECDEAIEGDLEPEDRDRLVGLDHEVEQILMNAESIIADVKRSEDIEALARLKNRFLELAGSAHIKQTFDAETYNARAQEMLEMKRAQQGKKTM